MKLTQQSFQESSPKLIFSFSFYKTKTDWPCECSEFACVCVKHSWANIQRWQLGGGGQLSSKTVSRRGVWEKPGIRGPGSVYAESGPRAEIWGYARKGNTSRSWAALFFPETVRPTWASPLRSERDAIPAQVIRVWPWDSNNQGTENLFLPKERPNLIKPTQQKVTAVVAVSCPPH